MNMLLMDKARSMLSGAGIAQEFWEEAVDIEKYLVNRSPSSMLAELTPYVVWFGNNPSIAHLKSFGCDASCSQGKEEQDGQEGS
jgi:hypothetical protein